MRRYHQLANRYITRKKTNSISIFISIALSVSILVAALMIMNNIEALEESKYIREFGDYNLRVVGIDEEKLEELDKKEYIDKVYYAETRGIYNNTLPSGEENIIEFYALDKDAFSNMIDFELTSGRLPENENEIMINSKNIEAMQQYYTIGDTLDVELEVNRSLQDYEWFKRYTKAFGGGEFSPEKPFNGDIMNEHLDKTIRENKQFKVVGIFKVDYQNELWSKRAITVMDKNALDKNERYDVYLDVNKSGVEEDLSETLGVKYVKETMNSSDYGMEASCIKENGYTQIASKKAEQNSGIIFIITIFCFLVVRNIINISISQKIKHYGVLRAIGANSMQLTTLIMKEVFAILICAIPFGIALGFGFLYGVCEILNSILGMNYEIVVSMGISNIGIVIAIISAICLISSLLVLRREMVLTPIDAIQDSKGLARDKRIKAKNFLGQEIQDDDEDPAEALNELLAFEGTTIKAKIMRKIFGFEGQLGHKNISRDKQRNGSCITSITTTMIIILLFIMQGITGLTGAKFSRASDNWELTLTNDIGIVDENTIDKVKSIDGVDNVYKDLRTMIKTTLSANKASWELTSHYKNKNKIIDQELENLNLNINVRGVDEETLKLYDDYLIDGEISKDLLNDNEIILVSKFTNYYQEINQMGIINHYTQYDLTDMYKVGDKIKVDGLDKELEVKAIVSKDALSNNMDSHDISTITGDFSIITSEKTFESLTGKKGSNTVLIDTHKENNDELIKNIEESVDGDFIRVKDEKAYQESVMEETIETMGINAMYAVIIIALVFINLVSTLTANILSRKGELAALSSIGMTSRQMSKMIVSESIAMVLASLTVVIPVAAIFTLTTQFSRGDDTALSNMVVVTIVIAVIAILSAVAILLSIIPLRIIKKLNIVDTLKEEV